MARTQKKSNNSPRCFCSWLRHNLFYITSRSVTIPYRIKRLWNKMQIITALLLLVSFLAGPAFASKSCRNCLGGLYLAFASPVTSDFASSVFAASLGNCATGGHALTKVDTDTCLTVNGQQACMNYLFNINVYRYCGNGGQANYNRGTYTYKGVKVATDKLSMTCNLSVKCGSTPCSCSTCAC